LCAHARYVDELQGISSPADEVFSTAAHKQKITEANASVIPGMPLSVFFHPLCKQVGALPIGSAFP